MVVLQPVHTINVLYDRRKVVFTEIHTNTSNNLAQYSCTIMNAPRTLVKIVLEGHEIFMLMVVYVNNDLRHCFIFPHLWLHNADMLALAKVMDSCNQ